MRAGAVSYEKTRDRGHATRIAPALTRHNTGRRRTDTRLSLARRFAARGFATLRRAHRFLP